MIDIFQILRVPGAILSKGENGGGGADADFRFVNGRCHF